MPYKRAKIIFSIVFIFASLIKIFLLGNTLDEQAMICLMGILVIAELFSLFMFYYDGKKAVSLGQNKKITIIDAFQFAGILCYLVGKVGFFDSITMNVGIYLAAIILFGIALIQCFKTQES